MTHDDPRRKDPRNRINTSLNRARVGLEVRRAVRPGLVTAAGVLIAIVLFAWIARNMSETFLASKLELRFAADDVTGVVPRSNEVRYKGVVAGKISKVEHIDGRPVISVQIREEYGPIYRDATAELRPNTPLQDMYLNITDRGTKAAGIADVDHIVPASQTQVGVQLNDVLGIFRASERARMATLLDQLGNGLDDHGAQLRATLVELGPLLEAARAAVDQLDRRRPQVARLIHNVGVLSNELSRSEGQISRVVRATGTTVSTLADGSDDLAATLDKLAPTLNDATRSFASVRGVLDPVDEAVRALRPVGEQLPASLDDLEAVATSARPAVDALQTPVRRLVPTVRELQPLSRDLHGAVAALAPQTDSIDKLSKGLADCALPLQRFFQWNASFTKYGDVRAPSPRGQLVLGLQSSGVTTSPLEFAVPACTPGGPIPGRPARDEDGH